MRVQVSLRLLLFSCPSGLWYSPAKTVSVKAPKVRTLPRTLGELIAAACNLVLKTKGTVTYGDRHLSSSLYINFKKYWDVVQFGRTPDLGSGGRGFDSHHSIS